MAKKIKELFTPTIPLTGGELLEMSQDNVSVKVNMNQVIDKLKEDFTEKYQSFFSDARDIRGEATGENFTHIGNYPVSGASVGSFSFILTTFKDRIWVLGGVLDDGAFGYTVTPRIYSTYDGIEWEYVGDFNIEGVASGYSLGMSTNPVVWKDKIWAVGPQVSKSLTENVKNFNVYSSPDAINWSIEGQFPKIYSASTNRNNHTYIIHDDKIWVMGGNENPNNQSILNIHYSEDGKKWFEAGTDALPFPDGLSPTSVLSYNDKLWIIGGNPSGAVPVSQKVFSSTDGETWTEEGTDTLPDRMSSYRQGVYDGKMWIFQPNHPNAFTATDEMWYSSDGQNWTIVSSDIPLKSLNYTIYNGRIFGLGGSDDAFQYYNRVYRSDLTLSGLVISAGEYLRHNDLSNIQGGTPSASEFYHLSQDIYNGLFSASPVIGLGENDFNGSFFRLDYANFNILSNLDGQPVFEIDKSDYLDMYFGNDSNATYYFNLSTEIANGNMDLFANLVTFTINNKISLTNDGLALSAGVRVNEISTDLISDSDRKIPTVKAVNTGDATTLLSANNTALGLFTEVSGSGDIEDFKKISYLSSPLPKSFTPSGGIYTVENSAITVDTGSQNGGTFITPISNSFYCVTWQEAGGGEGTYTLNARVYFEDTPIINVFPIVTNALYGQQARKWWGDVAKLEKSNNIVFAYKKSDTTFNFQIRDPYTLNAIVAETLVASNVGAISSSSPKVVGLQNGGFAIYLVPASTQTPTNPQLKIYDEKGNLVITSNASTQDYAAQWLTIDVMSDGNIITAHFSSSNIIQMTLWDDNGREIDTVAFDTGFVVAQDSVVARAIVGNLFVLSYHQQTAEQTQYIRTYDVNFSLINNESFDILSNLPITNTQETYGYRNLFVLPEGGWGIIYWDSVNNDYWISLRNSDLTFHQSISPSAAVKLKTGGSYVNLNNQSIKVLFDGQIRLFLVESTTMKIVKIQYDDEYATSIKTYMDTFFTPI